MTTSPALHRTHDLLSKSGASVGTFFLITDKVYYLQTEAIGPRFVRIALPALLIGFIAWRAKSIFASMVTLGFFSAGGDMLLHTRSLSEAVNVGWTVILGQASSFW